jgi:hypothetical protein
MNYKESTYDLKSGCMSNSSSDFNLPAILYGPIAAHELIRHVWQELVK